MDSRVIDAEDPEIPATVDCANIELVELEAPEADSVATLVTEVLTLGEEDVMLEEIPVLDVTVALEEAVSLAVTVAVDVPFAVITVSVLENSSSPDVEELEVTPCTVLVVVESVMVIVAEVVEVVVPSVVHVVELNNLSRRTFSQPLLFLAYMRRAFNLLFSSAHGLG